jgi:hypothetical protein
MFYGVINICIAPERRWEGIGLLKALARWLTEKYGAETTLLDNRSGAEDQKQLVTRYQSQAQMIEIDRQLTQDAEFDAWLREAQFAIHWDCTPGDVYRVME